MAKIYVASSWRNKYYPEVVSRLRMEGHDVYDFRNPPHGGAGFHWTDVDENAPNWTFAQYAGKKVFAYIPEMVEPELMYKLFDGVVGTLDDLVRLLGNGRSLRATGARG